MGDAAWRWRTIEHTGDLAIEVEAPSLGQLFLAGAHGLVGVLLGEEAGPEEPEPPKATVWRELALEGPDREILLVDWLRELLYIQMSEDLLLAEAEIGELAETRLVARAGFAPPAPGKGVERELKAVTYHDLEVSWRGNSWYARIVFDI
jgi:SHS2 domain-containing protein